MTFKSWTKVIFFLLSSSGGSSETLRGDAERAGWRMTEAAIGESEGPIGVAAAGRVSDERSEESARQALSRRFPVIRDRLRESRLPEIGIS